MKMMLGLPELAAKGTVARCPEGSRGQAGGARGNADAGPAERFNHRQKVLFRCSSGGDRRIGSSNRFNILGLGQRGSGKVVATCRRPNWPGRKGTAPGEKLRLESLDDFRTALGQIV